MVSKVANGTLLVLVGAIAGWQLRGYAPFAPLEVRHHPLSQVEQNVTVISGALIPDTQDTQGAAAKDKVGTKPDVLASLSVEEQFGLYLENRQYDAAVEMIQNDTARDRSRVLRKQLLALLSSLMSDKPDEFVDLSDAYLAVFYDDVDAYLLLAEFNFKQGYFIEAVSVFQLANEYAYDSESRQRVEQRFSQYLTVVDKQLVALNDWYSLNHVYLQAILVDLLNTQQKFRFAEVLIANGDQYYAKQILTQLLADRTVGGAAQKLLASLGGDSSPKMNVDDMSGAIDLIAQGNQFIVPITLSGSAQTPLLIDTGASLTTLSKNVFDAISSKLDYQFVGRRMFATANGLVRGDVIRVDSIQLGDFVVKQVDISVLDFTMHSDVAGLLGMNVLGKFRFQIDQDESKLLLQKR